MLQAESYHIYMQEVYSFKIFHISMTFVPLWLQHHHLSLSLPGHSEKKILAFILILVLLPSYHQNPRSSQLWPTRILITRRSARCPRWPVLVFLRKQLETLDFLGKWEHFKNYGESRVIQYWPSSSQGGHDARAGQPEALILISRRFGRLPEIATNGQ